jgi:hypothetical protein
MKLIKRAKVHTRYKQNAGNQVAGITTITKYLGNAQVLINWANRLGLEGMEVGKYVDELASIGVCVHYKVECDLQDMEEDLGDYTGNQIGQATQCMTKFHDWKRQHNLVTIAMERPLTSNIHPFGGTGDWFGLYDGELTYIDFKTAKACYLEHKVQAVACTRLWKEHTGDMPKRAIIIRLGRDMDEGFEEIEVADKMKDPMWEAFTLCCRIHELKKVIDPWSKPYNKRYVKKK